MNCQFPNCFWTIPNAEPSTIPDLLLLHSCQFVAYLRVACRVHPSFQVAGFFRKVAALDVENSRNRVTVKLCPKPLPVLGSRVAPLHPLQLVAKMVELIGEAPLLVGVLVLHHVLQSKLHFESCPEQLGTI